MKKTELLRAVLVLLCLPMAIAQAQPAVRQIPAAGKPDPRAKDITILQQSAKAFIEAFNKGDSRAVASLWAPGGEYIDETGKRFVGQPEVDKKYAKFFAENRGAKINLAIDSLRLTGDNTAIEDGRAIVELGGEQSSSQYSVVHTKVDGRWLMASVRDSPAPSASGAMASMLGDLDWLVGSWSAEENGGKMDVQVRWVAEKSFLERTYSVRRGDKLIASGVQMIGWNPQAGRIQSWTFTSGGGHATGFWMPRKNGWAVETTGMTAEGTPTQAINLLTRLDDGAFSWQSVERTAGGAPLADTEPVLLKRTESKQ